MNTRPKCLGSTKISAHSPLPSSLSWAFAWRCRSMFSQHPNTPVPQYPNTPTQPNPTQPNTPTPQPNPTQHPNPTQPNPTPQPTQHPNTPHPVQTAQTAPNRPQPNPTQPNPTPPTPPTPHTQTAQPPNHATAPYPPNPTQPNPTQATHTHSWAFASMFSLCVALCKIRCVCPQGGVGRWGGLSLPTRKTSGQHHNALFKNAH